MQVAFDAKALGIDSGHDPSLGGLDFGHPGPPHGGQASVCQGQARGRGESRAHRAAVPALRGQLEAAAAVGVTHGVLGALYPVAAAGMPTFPP